MDDKFPEARIIKTQNGYIVNFGNGSNFDGNSFIQKSYVAKSEEEVTSLIKEHLS